jgi:hypothetical protein
VFLSWEGYEQGSLDEKSVHAMHSIRSDYRLDVRCKISGLMYIYHCIVFGNLHPKESRIR